MIMVIHDARNLAWKLAAVLKGQAGPSLLDTYTVEREPVGRVNAAESRHAWDGLHRRGSTADGPQPPRRQPRLPVRLHRRAPRQPLPLPTAPGDPADPAAPGHRAPHLWLDPAPHRRSTIDLFDQTFVLLHGPAGTGWAADAVPPRNGHGVPLARHAITDPTCPARYGVEPSGAVLVRPDGHVGWRRWGRVAGYIAGPVFLL